MPQDRTDRDAQANPKPADAPAKPILRKLPATPKLQHRVLPPVNPVPDDTVPATIPVIHPEPVPAPSDGSLEQKALGVTRKILDALAAMKRAFLRVVMLLGQVRDEKLYAALGHATIEAYAQARLGLGIASLYRYLKVYDWLRETHPDWLTPGAKVKLADLNDANDLIWIEKQLARDNLSAGKKAILEDLQGKARAGTMRRSELRAYKAHGNKVAGGNRAFLAKLRRLRTYGTELAGLPEGVIAHLDAAIDLLQGDAADTRKQAKRKASKRPMTVK